MTLNLRVILIICSILSFILCVRKIKQAKLKVENSIIWMSGSIIFIFSKAVEWISQKLGFMAPVNFVFVTIIAFLLIEVYMLNLKITEVNEKVKNLNHYIALRENEEKNKRND